MKPIKKSPVIAWITGLSYISKENYFYKKYNLCIIPIHQSLIFSTRCFSPNVYIYLNYPSAIVVDVFLRLEGW